MALANVAFLAAMNGKRVLAMDWDLEAPGLAYYFRSLVPFQNARNLKVQPGILNVLWDWRNTQAKIAVADNEEKVSLENQVLASLASGEMFEDKIVNFIDVNIAPLAGTLDFIGAGSKTIAVPDVIAYEDALARFPWSEFIQHDAGGLVIESLRRWAKSRYDIVLIDSRTGLADVAGLCTMQIPDRVALCFILNHQNIDGVAKVAGAIRASHPEGPTIRAVPMRVARQDTAVEADARARAISELTRVGGFSKDTLLDDFRLLEVKVAEDVPFYETLAPFIAVDPQLDLLTLNYLRLAKEICESDLTVPSLDSQFVESVKARLQPRHATLEYVVSTLPFTDPDRALHELQRLVDSAHEAEIDGQGLDDRYIDGLVEATFGVAKRATDEFQAFVLENSLLDLLRTLSQKNPTRWSFPLAVAIEEYLEFNFTLESEEEIELLYELDQLLSQVETILAKLKRISFQRILAKIFSRQNNFEGAIQAIGEFISLVNTLRQDTTQLSTDQVNELDDADIDAHLIRGELYLNGENLGRAKESFESGMASIQRAISNGTRPELNRFSFDCHSSLADVDSRMELKISAASHAIAASQEGVESGIAIRRFSSFARFVADASDQPDMALNFCAVWFDESKGSRAQLANYYGRQPQFALDFLEVMQLLVRRIRTTGNSNTRQQVVEKSADLSCAVLRLLSRRKQTIGPKIREKLLTAFRALSDEFSLAELSQAGQHAWSESAALIGRGANISHAPD